MLGGADNPNGELPSYITGADMLLNYSFLACFSQYELHYSDAAYVTPLNFAMQ
ncbi:hypothetical protein U9860_21950 [Escherichia coli]